jgi:hypothetical protein
VLVIGLTPRIRLAEGAVGDALQEAGVVLEAADGGPANFVGVAVEMLVAEALQPGEHLVDLGLLADEGIQSRRLVAACLLGAKLMAGSCLRVQAGHCVRSFGLRYRCAA